LTDQQNRVILLNLQIASTFHKLPLF